MTSLAKKKKLPKLGKLQKDCDRSIRERIYYLKRHPLAKKNNKKHPQIDRKCKECGKDFKTYFSNIKKTKGGGSFCERKCWIAYAGKFPIRGALGKHWKHTADYKKRLSLSRMGEKNPNYISGSTKTRRAKTQRIKNWRNKVFKRDDYICQECGKRGGYKEAHHIIFWSEDRGKRFLIGNGITLCFSCHKSIHKLERCYRNLLNGKIKL